MNVAARDTRALLAALPFSAAVALFVARLLPVRFDYEPNALGIVSYATVERYPQQQETFWLLASAVCAVLVSWGVARWLASRAASGFAAVGIEVLGTAALVAALWLPASLATGVGLGCVLALAWLSRPVPEPPPASPALAAPAPPATHALVLLVAGSLGLALALTGDFWANAWSVATGFDDADRALDGFPFMGEIGQHLAWANALRRGEFHGKDFFCLYGPLYDLGLVGMWKLFGRSIVVWDLYFSLTRVVALAGLLALTGLLLRQRMLLLCIPFLVPWISLRSGLAFIGLCFLYAWLARGRPWAAVAAGVTAGVALLFSQEFGLAFTLVALLAFGLHLAWRPALCFGVGAAAIVLPVFAWYAVNDALLPMLREIAGYPAYVVAGYAKLPFPSLLEALPLDPAAWGGRELLAVRIGYGVPVICIGAALLALPISKLDWRAPLASASTLCAELRADPTRTAVLLVAVFGMLAFRTALGRSDLKHLIDPVPAAALLLVVGLDRVVAQLRSGSVTPAVGAWRVAALAVLVVHAGLTVVPTPLRDLRNAVVKNVALWRDGRGSVGDANVMRVARRLELETEVGEPILFLPNNGAYYYLTNRPSPIRFVMGHQIVTQAHRDEVLTQLSADPPRYLVWDDGALRVDGLSDEQVFGAPLLDWLDAQYVEVERYGAVSIRRHVAR